MYISKNNSTRQDWAQVKSWNYKLPHLKPGMSVVYAEILGEHGEVTTRQSEWVYYIIEGSGEFTIDGHVQLVETGDVITVPARTNYNYKSLVETSLKVVMFIDLWDD